MAGNYIGTNALGTAAVSNSQDGVAIDSGAQNNRIGVYGPDTNASEERNVISGNTLYGVQIGGTSSGVNTTGNIVAGNYVGTNALGTAAVPNNAWGVIVYGGAQNNRIGVNGPDTNASAERNVISGNAGYGVAIEGTSSGSNTTVNVVAGNYIGTNAADTGALGNGNDGVYIYGGAQSNLIGTNGSGMGDAAEENVISDNADQGVQIDGTSSGPNTTNNVVAGNFISTNTAGTAIEPYGNNGVLIDLARSPIASVPTAPTSTRPARPM